MSPWSKLKAFFRRKALDAEMAEELRHHLEQQTVANIRSGMAPEEARYAAQRQFGHVDGIKELARERRTWVWLEQTLQDFRHALRQLPRRPAFSIAIVLILAIGIAVNCAVFSIVDALLFRPLPVKEPSSLLAVSFVNPEGATIGTSLSKPYLGEFQSRSHSFSQLAASAPIYVRLRARESAVENAYAEVVTGNYFPTMGITAARGRLLLPSDDEVPGRQAVAVISDATWRTLYGSDPDVVGQTLQANQQALTIVGVAPAEFQGLDTRRPAQFWIPAAMEIQVGAHTGYEMVGRLAPGVRSVQATAELNALTIQITESYGQRAPPGYERYGRISPGLRPVLVPAALGSWGHHRGGRGNLQRLSALFAGAVGLVLLVACANAANLLLLRGLARRREIAVRLALGATRFRLLRQLGMESLLLALLAAMIGLLLARWGTEALLAMRTGALSFVQIDIRLDGRMLGFTAGLAALTVLFFGLTPAVRALRFDLFQTMKTEMPVAVVRHGRFGLRNLLVLAQVAAGLVLLLGAGLCLRSFAKLITLDPGFDTRNVLTATFSLDPEKFPRQNADMVVAQLLENLADSPGVQAVSLTNHMIPLSGNIMTRGIDELEGYTKRAGENIQFAVTGAGPDYFRLLGIPVVQGREFDFSDVRGRPRTAVVNEAFVRHYWPDQNPLGKYIENSKVVGVVADSRNVQLWREAEPQMYPAQLQGDLGVFSLLIRTEGDPLLFAPMLREVLAALDPSLKASRIETLQSIWSASLAGQRALLVLLSFFAAVALLLAAAGLYSSVAFSVSQRTREIGIRIALGARRMNVMSLVLRQSMGLVATGLAVGLVLALAATRALAHMLFGITPTDALTYTGVTLLLAAVALVACWLAARRATNVDPMIALRSE